MKKEFRTIHVARFVCVALVALLLVACGSAQHAVKLQDQQAFQGDTHVTVGNVSNDTGQQFDVDVEQMLRNAVTLELENAGLYSRQAGTGVMVMNMSITDYQKGDAFKRWLMPGYGSTVLTIHCELVDSEGNVDAMADARRTVDAGGAYTIGAWESIFNQVAKDLVEDLRKQKAGA